MAERFGVDKAITLASLRPGSRVRKYKPRHNFNMPPKGDTNDDSSKCLVYFFFST